MIIGIDPGVSGAVGILTDTGEFSSVHDLPVRAKLSGKGNEIDAATLANLLREYPGAIVFAERVQAMPPVRGKGGKQRSAGTQSSFNFGETAGVIRGVVLTLGLRLEYITPEVWKRRFGLTGKDKDAARTYAMDRFPEAAEYLTRKKDNGRADALLIAVCGLEDMF